MSPVSGVSMKPVASRHAWTRSIPARAMLEPPVHELQPGRRDDELVADPLEDATPSDPARIHDLEDAVDLATPDEPDAGEDVEHMERVDSGEPVARLQGEPAPVGRLDAWPEAFIEGCAEGARWHRPQEVDSRASRLRRHVDRGDRADQLTSISARYG